MNISKGVIKTLKQVNIDAYMYIVQHKTRQMSRAGLTCLCMGVERKGLIAMVVYISETTPSN